MANKLTLRISASADRNLSSAFRPLTDAAKRARSQLEAEAKAAAKETTSANKRAAEAAAKEYEKATKQIEKWQRQQTREAERNAAQQAKAVQRSAKAQERASADAARKSEAETAKLTRQMERAMAQEAKAADRSAKARARAVVAATKESMAAVAAYTRFVEREADKQGRATARSAARAANAARRDDVGSRRSGASGALGFVNQAGGAGLGAMRRAAGAATGLLGGIAHGMGVQTDLGQLAGQGVDLEKTTTDLANAGYMPGKDGAAGVRQDPAAIQKEIRQVASATATDPNKAAEGLAKFVGKTGDLETGRAIMMDMARYSRATGSSLDDMSDAAGDVANALGETDNKAEKVKSVMRAIAAQGKEGAVEIKDLAKQMAKLGAASGSFTGDPVKVMADMGALVQMTRAHGGAASSTQAATSVTSFADTFRKGARLDAFKHMGVKVKNEQTGQNLAAKDIIVNAIAAAGSAKNGGLKNFDTNMNKMFAATRARSVTAGFEKEYLAKGGGEAGIQAVKEAFDNLARQTMTEADITTAFNLSMGTAEAKVQLFNNQMAEASDDLRSGLQPALEGLAPVAISAAKELAALVTFLTGVNGKDKKLSQLEGVVKKDVKNVGRLLAADNAHDAKGNLIPKELGSNVKDKLTAEKETLDKAIADEEKRLAFLRAPKKKAGFKDVLQGKPVLDMLVNDPAKKAEADKVASVLQDLKTQQADLRSTLSAIAGAEEAGTLKVTIVADRSPKAAVPQPVVDGGGRTPEPEL